MPVVIHRAKGESNLNQSENYRRQAYAMVSTILGGNHRNFRYHLNDRTSNYLLVNDDGRKLLGFAFMRKPKHGRDRLDLLGTVPGKGHGRMLMDAVYANAKKSRAAGVNVLNALRQVHGFYTKMGYTLDPGPMGRHGFVFRRSVSAREPSPVRSNSRGRIRKRSPSPETPTSKAPRYDMRPRVKRRQVRTGVM